MSEWIPGPDDFRSPIPGQTGPLVWHEGQAWSRESAAARHAELIRDSDFGKAAAAGDPAKLAELHTLKRIELGLSPEPVPPATPEEVHAQMQDADRMLDAARLTAWERHIRMDEVMRFEHRRGLATAEQHETALREIEKMKADRAFGARVLAGDMDAKDRWMRWGRVASMQVAPPDHNWNAK